MSSGLISVFVDDRFHPVSDLFIGAFNSQEIISLSKLFKLLCIASDVFEKVEPKSVKDVLETEEWKSVIKFSQNLCLQLGKTN